MNRRISICFVAHSSYQEMVGGRGGLIGGIQRQQSLMAKWLASRGHCVSMLTTDEGQGPEELIDGVRVIRLHREDEGLPTLRFFHPRWTKLIAGMRKADAQVYYHNNAEYITGQVALWCRRQDRRFVFSTAHDSDCERELIHLPHWRERLLYRYGLFHANRVISQTLTQRSALLDNFGLSSTVISMICPPSQAPYVCRTDRADPPRVLWVGRIAPNKRLEMLLDIAERSPDLMFDVAGVPREGSDYGARVLARAATIPNVVLHGHVPRERMPELYRRAVCLVCTSTKEGFPNTFLEAWSEGTPLVTTFDADHLVAKLGLGGVGTSANELVPIIHRLACSQDAWDEASSNAREHFDSTYRPEVVMPQFESVFIEAAS